MRIWLIAAVGVFAVSCRSQTPAPSKPTTTPATTKAVAEDATGRDRIKVELGKVREPLPYRIISFHKGKADKKLIRLASQLGFNGVQIQIEGSNVDGIKAFAKYDAKEKLVDFCHSLGMKVTVWVHELSDVPPPWVPEWMGPITVENKAVWELLDARYEWMLRDAIPNVDGLVLTVVETQIRATDTPVLLKLAALLRSKTDKYGKSLIVRTFVWYPEEFSQVMAAVNQLAPDQIIMSKCVPQDWNMRGIDASEIGNVGGRPQIEEFDACGEYFLRDRTANCMVEIMKRQMEYGIAKGIKGICVRVDRDDASVLHQPSEVNLWTLGMIAGGVTDDTEEIWKAWASNRFGKKAAPGVITALKPTSEVVAELLSIGPFTFGDTRVFPPLADEDLFDRNWQSVWWDPKFAGVYKQAKSGDASFAAEVRQAKARAIKEADLCLTNLELVKDRLSPADYAILKTKLLTNKMQLEIRAPMAMAVLDYRRMFYAPTKEERAAADVALQQSLEQVRIAARPVYDAPTEITHLDKKWKVGPPHDLHLDREKVYLWVHQMDTLRRGEDPRK